MKNKILVIKIGGVLLDSSRAMNRLFTVLSEHLISNDRNVIIVHGGGRLIDELMHKLNLPIIKKNGLRITPDNHINIITGVLSGTVNKILLSWAKRKNIEAVGLCLSDGNSLNVDSISQDLGHVGHPSPGSSKFLNKLLNDNILPIISSIGITQSGQLMNVNADLAASALAKTLNADLILLSDISAILDGKGQRIVKITRTKAMELIQQGIITNGMIVKVNAGLEASHYLNRTVEIASWQDSKKLSLLLNGVSIGTQIIP